MGAIRTAPTYNPTCLPSLGPWGSCAHAAVCLCRFVPGFSDFVKRHWPMMLDVGWIALA